jgi:ketosteroid isomerase-like protein
MLKLAAATLFALLAQPSLVVAQNPPEAVMKVVADFKASELSSNGADRAALFSDDALVFNAWDNRHSGRKDVDAFWASLFTSGTFTKSTIVEKSMEYKKLSDVLWLVDYIEILSGQQGPRSGRVFPPRQIHMTLIIRRESGPLWRIVYFRAADARGFPPRPPAGDSATK